MYSNGFGNSRVYDHIHETLQRGMVYREALRKFAADESDEKDTRKDKSSQTSKRKSSGKSDSSGGSVTLSRAVPVSLGVLALLSAPYLWKQLGGHLPDMSGLSFGNLSKTFRDLLVRLGFGSPDASSSSGSSAPAPLTAAPLSVGPAPPDSISVPALPSADSLINASPANLRPVQESDIGAASPALPPLARSVSEALPPDTSSNPPDLPFGAGLTPEARSQVLRAVFRALREGESLMHDQLSKENTMRGNSVIYGFQRLLEEMPSEFQKHPGPPSP